MTIKEPNRRIGEKFYCPFCKNKESKLIPSEQAEYFRRIVPASVVIDGRMPLQCFSCRQKEELTPNQSHDKPLT